MTDYGYPHPDDLTPRVQRMIDADMAADAIRGSKHTGGTWVAHVYDTHYVITAEQGRHSVQLAVVNRDPVVLPETWEMHKANARLMAASPFLLDACEAALKFLLAHPIGLGGHHAEEERNKLIAWLMSDVAKAIGSPAPTEASQADGQLPDGVAHTVENGVGSKRQCEWCGAAATHRIRVPWKIEGGGPYTRYGCDAHRAATERLVCLDFCKSLTEIGAEVTHNPSGVWPDAAAHTTERE